MHLGSLRRSEGRARLRATGWSLGRGSKEAGEQRSDMVQFRFARNDDYILTKLLEEVMAFFLFAPTRRILCNTTYPCPKNSWIGKRVFDPTWPKKVV